METHVKNPTIQKLRSYKNPSLDPNHSKERTFSYHNKHLEALLDLDPSKSEHTSKKHALM